MASTGIYISSGGGATSTITDTFTRSETNQWGNSDTGEAWTITGVGTQADVDGSQATFNFPVSGTSNSGTLAWTAPDVQLTVDMSIASVPTTGIVIQTINLRSNGSGTRYEFRIGWEAGSVFDLSVIAYVGGTPTTLNTPIVNEPYVANDVWRVVAYVSGTDVKAKAWAVGDSDPGWLYEGTDASVASGTMVGLAANRGTATWGTPIYYFDNLAVEDLSGSGTPLYQANVGYGQGVSGTGFTAMM